MRATGQGHPRRVQRRRSAAEGRWRESGTLGDDLDTRPDAHVRVRARHQYTQMWYGQAAGARSDKDFAASLQIDDTGSATRADVDKVFLTLLQAIDAENVTEIAPYD